MSQSFDSRSLKQLLVISWAIPAAVAVCASLLAFFIAGWIDYQGANDRIRDDLTAKAQIAARRISGELLLGSAGRIETVSKTLQTDLNLSDLAVQHGYLPCKRDLCSEIIGPHLTVHRQIEAVADPHYVTASLPRASFADSLNPRLFMWSAIPIGLLLAMGLLLQRRLLSRHVIEPISALVETSVQSKTPPIEWPTELQDISRQLARSFEERDQAVLGQIAAGVIHDLKTLLQSIRNGTELVRELDADSPKRTNRLESLYRVTSSNLPKMLQLIEMTLDGSRQIQINRRAHNVSETVRSAVEVNDHMARAMGVQLGVTVPEDLAAAHDPVQLERALANLIKNAIEAFYADDSGNSAISRLVNVSASSSPSGALRLVVEDSGPGLPSDFDDAFRTLRSSKLHGTGLGLTIARKIIEGHGGRLLAGRSSTLSGASFEIEIPKGASS